MSEDDASILGATLFFRRVHPEQVIWDENEARLRPTSAAFRDPLMSVNLGDDLESNGLDPGFALRNHDAHHLAALSTRFARGLGQIVYRDHQEADPTHGIVEGKKQGSKSNKCALEADWEVLREDSLPPKLADAYRGSL